MQHQLPSSMSPSPLSANDPRGPRNDGQRGAPSSINPQPTPGLDPVIALQQQLQSFNFAAAPGGVPPNGGQNQSPAQPGQGRAGGSPFFQQPSGPMNPGPSRDNPQAGQWPPGGQQQSSLPNCTPGIPPNGAQHQSSAQPGQSNPLGAQYPQQPQFNGAPPSGLGNSGPQNNASSAGPNILSRSPQQPPPGQAKPNAPPNASNVGGNPAMSQPNIPSIPNIPQNPQQQSQSNLNSAAAPFSSQSPFPSGISAVNVQGNPQQMAFQGQSFPSTFAMPQQPQPGAGQSNFGASQGQSNFSNLAMPQAPGAGQSNGSANPSSSQFAQRPSVGGNQPNLGPLPPPPGPNQRQQDNRMSMGSVSPTSERMGPPPIIPPPLGGNPQQDPFQAMNFNQGNLGRGAEQPALSSQPNPGGARGESLNPLFNANPGQGQQPQATPRGSLNGSQQLGQQSQQQVPHTNQVFLDQGIQTMVNQQLQSNIFQGLNIPFYPAPPDIASGFQQAYEPHIYQAFLVELANAIHQWSQYFDGANTKTLTPQHENIIKGCLDIFSPMEPGIVTALNVDQLSVEGLYYSPSHRRILAEHIIALNMHIFMFSPFFPGVEIPVGKLLASITDRLYTNRTSFPIYILMFSCYGEDRSRMATSCLP
jgi:hypothetical protein